MGYVFKKVKGASVWRKPRELIGWERNDPNDMVGVKILVVP